MPKSKAKTKAGKQRKVKSVMTEYAHGDLKSSSGKKVKSRKQAVAIALHEAGIPPKKK